MIIGFTGTQQGISSRQSDGFVHVLTRLGHLVTEFHHGDCVGADAEAHVLVRALCPNARIVIHPPDVDVKRAWCIGDEILTPLPYLDRNTAIVNVSDVLIAAPAGPEHRRSGTWSTIRRSRNANQPHFICWADGTIEKKLLSVAS